MSFPPELLDELARVYARAAVEAFLAALSEGNIEEPTEEKNDPPPSDDGR